MNVNLKIIHVSTETIRVSNNRILTSVLAEDILGHLQESQTPTFPYEINKEMLTKLQHPRNEPAVGLALFNC